MNENLLGVSKFVRRARRKESFVYKYQLMYRSEGIERSRERKIE